MLIAYFFYSLNQKDGQPGDVYGSLKIPEDFGSGGGSSASSPGRGIPYC